MTVFSTLFEDNIVLVVKYIESFEVKNKVLFFFQKLKYNINKVSTIKFGS